MIELLDHFFDEKLLYVSNLSRVFNRICGTTGGRDQPLVIFQKDSAPLCDLVVRHF